MCSQKTSHWQKLLKYYTSCITLENSGEVKLFSTKEGEEFVYTPAMQQEWVTSGKDELIFSEQDETVSSFLEKSQYRSSSAVNYYYGFPCNIDSRSRHQQIQPLFIFSIDHVTNEKGCSFILQSEKPRLNSVFLAKRGLRSAEEQKHAAGEILQKWNEAESRVENFKITLAEITKFFPGTVSKNVLNGTTTDLDDANGLIPIGVIYRSIGSFYTSGLERELKELEERDTSPNSVWQGILDRDITTDKGEIDNIIGITELNDEQNRAICGTLSSTVTVVTGPPGTGKSQVVLNIRGCPT